MSSIKEQNRYESALFCSKCGNKLLPDSVFCDQCGTQVPMPTTAKAFETNPPADMQFPQKKKANKGPIILYVVLGFLLAAAIAAAIFIFGNFGSSGSDHDNDHNSTVGTDNQEVTYNVGVRTITFGDSFTTEYVLASWENGEKTEQSMIAIMDQYGSEQGGGQLYVITPGEFIEEIDEWCFSEQRKPGDYAIIENAYGFSLCYFSSRNIEDDSISQNNYSSEESIMVVAIEADFAPYSWSEGGDYYGLHVDLAKEIARRTGKNVSFEIVDFQDLISGVDSGTYDMAFGLERTSEREELVTFTDEYYDGMCAIYHTKDDEPSFSEWAEYNKTLQDIKEDGTLKTILAKYNLS